MMKNNKGSALILVLFIVTIGILIGGTLLIYADSANNDTISYQRSEQAYFTARSAVAATIKYIQANYNNQSVMDDIMLNQGYGYSSELGAYTVNVAYTKTNEIKVSAAATYKNKKSTVYAYLTRTDKVPSIIPTDFLLFVNDSIINGNFYPEEINGSVYVNGDLDVTSDSKINKIVIAHGNVDIAGAGAAMNDLICFGNANIGNGGSVNGDAWVQGDLKLSGSSPIKGNVQCYGNVTLEGSSNINGNTLLKGDLTFDGGTKIVGDVQCDGNLNMPQGTIQGNATVGKNVLIKGGSPKITDGMLYYMGTLNYSEGTLSQFVPSGVEKISSYDPVDLDSNNYTYDNLPVITTPSLSDNVTLNNKTINSSGIITSDIFSSLDYGSTVTIDTSRDNISLIIDNTTFHPAKGINFEVTGSNNLYVYMTGIKASFDIESNQYMGMKNHGDTPKIFIFGDGSQTVSVTNNSELDANIYIPKGSFSASGSALNNNYKFQGSCITKSIDIQSNVSLNYLPPNIAGTPLEVLTDGQSGNNGNNWTVERWSDK